MNGINFTTNSMNKNGFKPHSGASYEEVAHTAEFLMARVTHRPKIGIICGSGLGGLANMITDPQCIDYKDIPNFPVSTVPGHAGRLVFGKLNGAVVMCMQGRVHGYEGYPMWKMALPVRVMKVMGIHTLIATNAAGGLDPEYDVGDVMIIKDHINLPGLIGNNPLVGPNDERFGPRFPALSEAYDKSLRKLARRCADDLGFDYIREGVYVIQIGPCFETVTECRMLRNMGANVTGMSTVPEVMVARHCGMRCFAISLVTNKCAMEYDTEVKANHEEVLETGMMRSKDMQQLISRIVGEMEDV